jgi:hypothetical protein
MTLVFNGLGDALFTVEGGGWLTLRRRAPNLRGLSAAELLQWTARSPGNVRYATDGDGPYLLEEVRSPDGLTLGTAGGLFLSLLPYPVALSAEPPSDELIEAAIDGGGFPWARRASSWSVVVTARQLREVLVSPVPGGARVTTTLTEWDEIVPVCHEALAEFLVAAQAGLRFARCEADGTHARVVAFAAAATVDADLPHALLGVAAGCELVAREAAALLRPEVAESYIDCRRIPRTGVGSAQSDGPAANGRGAFHDPREPEGR